MNELIEFVKVPDSYFWDIVLSGVHIGTLDLQASYQLRMFGNKPVECLDLDQAKTKADQLLKDWLISVLKKADGALLAEAGLMRVPDKTPVDICPHDECRCDHDDCEDCGRFEEPRELHWSEKPACGNCAHYDCICDV
jgi:hypothetical protein